MNSVDFSDKVNSAVQKVMNKYTKIALQEVKQFWSRYGKLPGDEAISDRKTSESKPPSITQTFAQIENNLIKTTITAAGRKAWIIEFGRGSMMETDKEENPWLEEYLNSPSLFNTARLSRGYAILGREQGEHNDLDGGTFYSSGKAKDRNIEQWRIHHTFRGKRNGKEGRLFDYAPILPTHIIRHTLYDSGLIVEMCEKIIEVVSEELFKVMRKNTAKEMLVKL